MTKRFGRHPRKRLNYLEIEYERVTRELRELRDKVEEWNHGLQCGLARLVTVTPPEVQAKVRKLIRTSKPKQFGEYGCFLEAASTGLYHVVNKE